MVYKIGIDVGGTFTDFLLTDEQGRFEVYKVLSTPGDPSIGLMNGLKEMAESKRMGLEDFVKQVELIVHGTTVTTNAVLTRSGVVTGLITTEGVRDALEMRRGIREEQYNNWFANVEPLVPRYLRLPVGGRVDWSGKEIKPIAKEDVDKAVEIFKQEGVEAVAICFMNSFANPSHEKLAADIVREKMTDVYLTVSSEFLPSIRFYDRISTTVLNSYVGPILKRYLENLVGKLETSGFKGVLLIMASSGGVVSPEVAAERAAISLLSGPAAGPVAGLSYASVGGWKDCITVDMGGTSFDAALIKNGSPLMTTEGEIARLRIALPMLNIVTIGAGGGSIGWIDEGGLLRMGPQSAGAKPGPACYGLGGELPTCTDADLLLGYLDKDFFAGGKIPLDYTAALRAIKSHIADKLKIDVMEAARGMYEVINVNMAAGVREVSVKRGEDPRDFPLVVAGGAGPVHACPIAMELEIPLIIVPRQSSIFCAAGMLMSDLIHDFVQTYAVRLSEVAPDKFTGIFNRMRENGISLLRKEGILPEKMRFYPSVDMRYIKQYHEVNILLTMQEIEEVDVKRIAERFHPEHNRLFGYDLKEEAVPIEIINLRLKCVGVTAKPSFRRMEYGGESPAKAIKGRRKVFIPEKSTFEEVYVFDGDRIEPGNRIDGPAIIEQIHTTTFLTSNYSMICDPLGSYTIFLKERGDIEERIKSFFG